MDMRSGKGDKGFTDLPFRKRISKDSADIRVLGELDELNGYLGLIKSLIKNRKDKAVIERIQNLLGCAASEIAVGTEKKRKLGLLLKQEDSDWAACLIYEMEQTVKKENNFSLPGQNPISAFMDIARSVARRADRAVVGLFKKEHIRNDNILTFMNCISDILFLFARKYSGKRQKNKAKKKNALKQSSGKASK
ncbi:MAG: cob(I)yrinic acid a,c-diamide adenosyltransferase [Candidatus Omnitrophota bacterium]